MNEQGVSRGEREMQERLGTVDRAARFYADQVVDRLNERMRAFVARQELVFVATADRAGACDSSLRAGPPGFVAVLDDVTLAWPEYRGNGVLASVGNIRESGRVGLLFVDFTRDRIGLHVNGLAAVVDHDDATTAAWGLPADEHPGRTPVVWVVVTVEEAYVHCSKHIPTLVPLPRQRHWGTDSPRRKGGDFFGVAAARAADRAAATRDAATPGAVAGTGAQGRPSAR